MRSTQQVQEQMFDHIASWQKSGQSQKKYCFDQNIRYHVFHYWFKRYRDGQDIKKESSRSFVKLQIASSFNTAPVELILPDGKRLLFHEGVSSEFLKALIS